MGKRISTSVVVTSLLALWAAASPSVANAARTAAPQSYYCDLKGFGTRGGKWVLQDGVQIFEPGGFYVRCANGRTPFYLVAIDKSSHDQGYDWSFSSYVLSADAFRDAVFSAMKNGWRIWINESGIAYDGGAQNIASWELTN